MRTTTTIAKVSTALSAVCLLGISLYAQSYEASAKVPFNFQVASTVLAAGQYSLGSTSFHNVAHLTNMKTGRSILITTYPGNQKLSATRSSVVFHRYGSEYFLAEIWAPAGIAVKVPATKREKELMLGPNPVAMVMVPVGVRAD